MKPTIVPANKALATDTSEAKVDVEFRRTRCAKLTPLGARPEKKVGHFRRSSASWHKTLFIGCFGGIILPSYIMLYTDYDFLDVPDRKLESL